MGVSIWLDDLNRRRLATGSLADLVAHDHVVGVTTNPTIFAKAITGGDEYAGQLHDLWARGTSVEEALRALATHDVRGACDVLRPVFDATDGVDGRVSIEVDPRLAYDTEATIAEARALWWRVDRPNLFVKIPAARQGLPAIAACLAEGISINVTLIFSLTRYDEVIDAFIDGLERARRAGLNLSSIASVASFFVSRVDTEIDARLDKIGTAAAARLRGRAAIANARLAYQRYEQMLGSPRWAALQTAGARPQRPLWASTSVKDPAYPDTRYVTDLVAPGVVNTMPEATLHAVADHGRIPADSVRAHYQDARRVLSQLGAVGVDYDDVTAGLEKHGLEVFDASWRELSDQLVAALRQPRETHPPEESGK
jgi:transaldolase